MLHLCECSLQTKLFSVGVSPAVKVKNRSKNQTSGAKLQTALAGIVIVTAVPMFHLLHFIFSATQMFLRLKFTCILVILIQSLKPNQISKKTFILLSISQIHAKILFLYFCSNLVVYCYLSWVNNLHFQQTVGIFPSWFEFKSQHVHTWLDLKKNGK